MSRVARHAGAALAYVAVLAAGLWFWAGVVAPGYWSAIALAVVWCVLVPVVVGKLAQRAPDLRVTLRVVALACSVALVGGGYWTSVRETTVDEAIIQGAPASSLSPGDRARELPADPLPPQG